MEDKTEQKEKTPTASRCLDENLRDTRYFNEMLDEFQIEYKDHSKTDNLANTLIEEYKSRPEQESLFMLDAFGNRIDYENFAVGDPADISALIKDLNISGANTNQEENNKKNYNMLNKSIYLEEKESRIEDFDSKEISVILHQNQEGDSFHLGETSKRNKVGSSNASDFFRNVDLKYDRKLEEKKNNNNESHSKSRILSLEEMVKSYRQKYTITPDPEAEPEHRVESKKERVSLVHLFKIYGETREITSHKKKGEVTKYVNPLEYLEDASIFTPKSTVRSAKQRSSANREETTTDTELGQHRDTIDVKSLNLTITVTNFQKLNNLNSLKSINISCVCFRSEVLLLGSPEGVIYEINVTTDTLVNQTKISQSEQAVNCLDINEELDMFAAGSNRGTLVMKSTKKGWAKKTITDRFGDLPILKVIFVSSRELLVQAGGTVQRIKLMKVSLLLEVQSWHNILAVDCVENVAIKFEYFKEKYDNRLLLATSSKIVFFKFLASGKEINEYEIPKPEATKTSDVIVMNLIGKYSVYSIIWGKILMIVKKLSIKDSDDQTIGNNEEGEENINYQILEKVDISTRSFDWGFCFSKHSMILFKNDGWVKIAGMGNFSMCIPQGAQYEDMEIPITEIPGFSKKIKSFLHNIENKTFRLPPEDSLVIVDENRFKLIKIIDPDQLIQQYVNAGQWHQAIKLAVRMFSSTSSEDSNRGLVREMIRIICLKYIDYFLPFLKPGNEMADSNHTDQVTDKRLRLIVQTLLSSESVDFVFDDLKKRIKSSSFWSAIQDMIERGVTIRIKTKFMTEELALMKETCVVELIQQAEDQILNEDDEQTLNLLCKALNRKGYWTAIYFLCLQFPQSHISHLFLSILLDTSLPKDDQEAARIPTLFNLDYVKAIYSSETQRTIFTSDNLLDNVLRFFYFLRKLIHLKEMTYFRNMEIIWRQVLEWILDKENIIQFTRVNLGLVLEVVCELLLKNEVALNQSILQHLMIVIRKARSINNFQLVDHLGMMMKKPSAKMHDEEIRKYSLKVVGELLEYLLEVLVGEFNRKHTQDIGFMSLKIFNITLFKGLLKDTPFGITFVKFVIGDVFEENRFYYFYKMISHSEFEQIVADSVEKILNESKIMPEKSVQELIQMADENGQ